MTNPTQKNKCALCGLRVTFNQKGLQQSKSVEDFFVNLRELQAKKIIPKGWPRNINVNIVTENPEDSSEICAINHLSWNKIDKKCKYWQPSIGLSLGEYLALHEARKMDTMTADIHKLTAIAVLIPVATIIIALYKGL